MPSEETSPLPYQNEDKDKPVRSEPFLPYWLKWMPARKVGLNWKEGKKEKGKNEMNSYIAEKITGTLHKSMY